MVSLLRRFATRSSLPVERPYCKFVYSLLPHTRLSSESTTSNRCREPGTHGTLPYEQTATTGGRDERERRNLPNDNYKSRGCDFPNTCISTLWLDGPIIVIDIRLSQESVYKKEYLTYVPTILRPCHMLAGQPEGTQSTTLRNHLWRL